MAAEILFRRRLVNRTAWFLVGAVVFVPASQVYPPLEIDRMWIFAGTLFFVTLGLAFWLDYRARRHEGVEILKRVCSGLVPVLWVLAALLYANGRFDRSQPVAHSANVVGSLSMAGLPRSYRLIVTSWREGHMFERVSVDRMDFDRFRLGDGVVVLVQEGLAGIPWVYGVNRP
ncbi:MAG: hypothetical protein WBF06_09850 [Candidatus Acidiferrales bacterium]